MSEYKGPRVRLTVRMPELLYDRLNHLCQQSGLAINDVICDCVQNRIKKLEKRDKGNG
jgi:hypothetical protein